VRGISAAAATTAAAREIAVDEPVLLDARTSTRSLLPTSTDASVYVLFVVPTMAGLRSSLAVCAAWLRRVVGDLPAVERAHE